MVVIEAIRFVHDYGRHGLVVVVARRRRCGMFAEAGLEQCATRHLCHRWPPKQWSRYLTNGAAVAVTTTLRALERKRPRHPLPSPLLERKVSGCTRLDIVVTVVLLSGLPGSHFC